MAGALGFGGSVAPAAPATPATPSAKAAGQVHRAPDVVPQSVFIDDPTFGCDPFFPESARRRSKINPNNGKPSAETAEKKLFSLLTVKGILGPKDNRMALINRYLFKVGDERNMKVGEGSVIHVKCLGITDHSVSVAIAGNSEILELPFPPRPVKTAPVGSPRAAPRSAH